MFAACVTALSVLQITKPGIIAHASKPNSVRFLCPPTFLLGCVAGRSSYAKEEIVGALYGLVLKALAPSS